MKPEKFTELMTHFPTGVAVVTALDDQGRPHGLTLTAFCSLSATPPLVLVSINVRSNTLPAIRQTNSFIVNLLAAGHEGVAEHFASKAESKFSALSVRTASDFGPILDEHSCAYLTCSVLSRFEVHDHELVVGEVHDGIVLPDRNPLVYGRRRFGAWASPPRAEVEECAA